MSSYNRVVQVRKDGTKRVQCFTSEVDKSTGEVVNPSLTKQAFKKDCDINHIMDRYEKTGVLEHVARYQGQYGDFSGDLDYQTCVNRVIEADEMFMSLPAKVRARFENDAGRFLDFVSDPANSEELVEMGLASPRVPVDKPVKDAEKPVDVSADTKRGEKP